MANVQISYTNYTQCNYMHKIDKLYIHGLKCVKLHAYIYYVHWPKTHTKNIN